jgi:hypothetical protein
MVEKHLTQGSITRLIIYDLNLIFLEPYYNQVQVDTHNTHHTHATTPHTILTRKLELITYTNLDVESTGG